MVHKRMLMSTFYQICIQLWIYITTQTYKPWIGNRLLKIQSYSERCETRKLPPRSYHSSASAILFCCVIHRYCPINIRMMHIFWLLFTLLYAFLVLCVYVLFKDQIYVWFILFTTGDHMVNYVMPSQSKDFQYNLLQ